MNYFIKWTLCAVAVLFISNTPSALADSISNFYAGRNITMVIPSPPGGSYNLYGRMVARHIGKQIPGNPRLIVKNMPGGGGVIAANYLYNVAAKDGSVIGMIRQNAAIEQLMGNKNIKYDVRNFHFIGRTNVNVPVHTVLRSLAVKSIGDLQNTVVITGAPGARSVPASYPRALNHIVGTKWKVVTGYKGGAAARLAFERGEVQAVVGPAMLYRKRLKKWLTSKKVRILVQYADFRHPLFPNVPHMVELGRTPEQKKILAFIASTAAVGRAFAAPPKVPAARVQALRAAFMKMSSSKGFRAEVKKRKVDHQPLSGDKLQELIARTMKTPKAIAEKARVALSKK